MICQRCLTNTVSWKGPITRLSHTECSNCGGRNCQVPEPQGEGDKCPHCGGLIEFEPVENCSCHINPPCGACTSARLTCTNCEEFFE